MSAFVTRPSSLPAQAKSPKWRGGGESDATMRGTDRHEALERLWDDDTSLVDLLPDDEREAVLWAHDYIRTVADMESHPLRPEQEVVVRDSRGVPIMRGTADVICGDDLFDLKWSERNYAEQMLAYAVGLMQSRNTDRCRVHVLYGQTRRIQSYEVHLDYALDTIQSIISEVSNPAIPCRVSEYCDWCSLRSTCEILMGHAADVARSVAVVPVERLDVASPYQVAQALNMAAAVEAWASGVREKAREMAKDGLQIPGYELRRRSGSREIEPHNIPQAFDLSAGIVSQGGFLSACKVSIPALERAVASESGMSAREARQSINDLLAPVIVAKPESVSLFRIK